MNSEELKKLCRVYREHPDIPASIKEACGRVLEASDSSSIFFLARAPHEFGAWKPLVAIANILGSAPLEMRLATHLLLSHAYCELGEGEMAANEMKTLGALVGGMDLEESNLITDCFSAVYRRANIHFNDGNRAQAVAVYNLALPHDKRLHHISFGHLGEEEKAVVATTQGEGTLEGITRCCREPLGVVDYPEGAQKLLSVEQSEITTLQGRRLLLVMRLHFSRGEHSRKHELQKNFRYTAEQLGINTSFFNADPFVFFQDFDEDYRRAAFAKLEDLIQEVKPEFVVFDNLCSQDQDEVLTADFYERELLRLKERFNFKLIALYPDAWHPPSSRGAMLAGGFADVLWHNHLSLHLEMEETVRAKSFVIPFPFPVERFDTQKNRDIDTAFVGTSVQYNYLRSLWFLAMEDAGIDYQLFLTSPVHREGMLTLTDTQYAELLGRINTSIQFSSRNENTKILCGRVWESMLAGCALIEEENIETKHFLVPYLHYIPFSSTKDLAEVVKCLTENPEERSALALRGRDWVSNICSGARIWGYMLLKA